MRKIYFVKNDDGNKKIAAKKQQPLLEDNMKAGSILEIAQMLAERFNGKGDLYEIKRYVMVAVSNNVALEEINKMISSSIDVKQFIRRVCNRIRGNTAKLRELLTDEEKKLMKKIFRLSESEVKQLDEGKPSEKLQKKIYFKILENEEKLSKNYCNIHYSFEEVVAIFCDYFGIDGNPAKKIDIYRMEVLRRFLEEMEEINSGD